MTSKRTRYPSNGLLEIAKGSQTIKYQELLVATNRLRIAIESDAYKFQCRASVERWDGTQWQRVWHIAAAAMKTQEGLVYLPRAITAADFAADRATLVAAAVQVLGTL